MGNNKNRKQVIFDIHQDIHQQIKVLSALQNISMSSFIQRAILKEIGRFSYIDTKEHEKPREEIWVK